MANKEKVVESSCRMQLFLHISSLQVQVAIATVPIPTQVCVAQVL